MAAVETKFGVLGTAQALTTKERVFISAPHILPATLSTDKLAHGSAVIREAERESSYGILLTPDEHLQISRDQINQFWLLLSTPSVESDNILRAAHHGQATTLLGVVHHGQATTLLGVVGQATSLLGAAHGQAGGLVGTTLAQTGTLVGLTHIHGRGLFGIGLRDLSHAPSPASLAEPFQQLTAGGAPDEVGLAKDFLKARIREVLSDAEHEELEIGIQSTFSRQLLTLFAEHGANAVEALGEVLRDKLASDTVMGILLRQLGRIQQDSSQQMRRKLLSDLLRARSVQVRHAAATGLAELDDPEAIPALELARNRERHERPREHFELVLEQLRETRSGGSVPHR